MSNHSINILMASAEASPFAKVGGLADVVGSLPPALQKQGCRVKLVMPLYGSIDRNKYKLKPVQERITVHSGNRDHSVDLHSAKLPGAKVEVFFVENEEMFGRRQVYWGNNSERFLFFSLAVLNCLPYLDMEPDVIHCHDFHTAMIPDLIRANSDIWGDIKTLYTIHNLNFQGKSETEVLSTGNLETDSLASLTRDASDGDINFMVQGIVNSDRVNTVSPTYAREIATSVYGAGLEKVIKQYRDKITGILNGIDIKKFNPETDKSIKYNYNSKFPGRKLKNKTYLQKMADLPQDKTKPLIGFISRLYWQKGADLITEGMIENLDAQFVFLGTGDTQYEKHLKDLGRKFPDQVSANITFDSDFAQQIYAGSDIFLMPSRFEPCGLGQMIAMRYGAVPVVRATGGLKDTVTTKLGFKFKEPEPEVLYKTLKKALKTYTEDRKGWKQMQKAGMEKDFSWERSAGKYYKLYQEILDI